MSNTKKPTVKRNREDNLTAKGRFKYAPQPTDEQKKAGMDKKTNRRKLADLLLEFGHLTKSQIEEHAKRKDLTINEMNVIRYVTSGSRSDKMLVDLMNREISYAPAKQEHTGAEGGPIQHSIKSILDDIIK